MIEKVFSDRGFARYTIPSRHYHGDVVDVYWSSSVVPAVWVGVTQGGADEMYAAHMTLEAAQELVDCLQDLIDTHSSKG